MRNLVNSAPVTTKVDFLGKKNAVELKKLTGKEVKQLQVSIKGHQALPEEEQGMAIQNTILRMTVVDAEDMSDEDFDSFPLDDLSKLTKAALRLSGITPDEGVNAEGNS